MKLHWNRKYTTIAVYCFLVIAASIVFCALIMRIDSIWKALSGVLRILAPFFYGFVIAYILNPVLRLMEYHFLPWITRKKLKGKALRTISILLAFLIAFLIIAGFVIIISPQIVQSVYKIVSNVPVYVTKVRELAAWVENHLPMNQIPEELTESISTVANSLAGSVSKFLTGILPKLITFTKSFTTSLLNVILGLVIAVYLFAGRERFVGQIRMVCSAVFSEETLAKLQRIVRITNNAFSGFLAGKLLDSLIIGVLAYLGLLIIGVPYAALCGVIVGITNIVPYFGPFIGIAISAVLVIIESPIKCLLMVIFLVILQQFDGNILGPKILSQSSGLSAFWVIFSILLFGKLFSVFGMIIGVPTVSVIYTLIRSSLNERLKQKGLSTSAEAYHPNDESSEKPA